MHTASGNLQAAPPVDKRDGSRSRPTKPHVGFTKATPSDVPGLKSNPESLGHDGSGATIALAALLALIGVARIAATYHVFSQTWDEPAHIAAGVEWLDRGTYTFEPLHPPLARTMTAVGPYLLGERLSGESNPWEAGNRILGFGAHYGRTLAAARAGLLPFFLLACVCVFLLARRLNGALGCCACRVLLHNATSRPRSRRLGNNRHGSRGGACEYSYRVSVLG